MHQPSKIDILPRNPQNPQNCLLSVFSHRLHRFTQIVWLPSRGCTCLRSALPLARARSAPTKQNRYSPTESTEPTELLAECILPQIAQIHTEVRLPSRGCTCLRSALPLARARSAPTKQNRYSPTESTEPTELLAEDVLPQIAQIYTELLAEGILPQIAQIYTEVRLPSRGCTCLRSALPLARARSAPTKQTVVLPQNPQNPQNFLQSVFPHRFHSKFAEECDAVA